MTDPIPLGDFAGTEGAADWRLVSEGPCAFFRTASFTESVRFVSAIGDITGVEDHQPAVDTRSHGVTVRLITVTSDYFGPSRVDLELARKISAVARGLGLVADPSRIQSLLIIPGAPDIKAVMPFWRAILDYKPRPDSPEEDLVDPRDRGAPFWFEQMEEPRATVVERSTSPSGCPSNRPRRVWQLPSRPVAASCATTSRPPGGHSPTPSATRPTSPRSATATEGSKGPDRP